MLRRDPGADRGAHAERGAVVGAVRAAVVGATAGAVVGAVRGVAFEAHRVQLVGIGNVELRAVARAHLAPPTMPGIVGQGGRKVRIWEYPLAEGDLFALLSDGLSTRFDLADLAHLAPQPLADALLAAYHQGHDDACCATARITSVGAA